MSRFVLGVTGASGGIYATRTAMYLQRFGHEVTLIVTHPGKQVLEYEGQSALFDYCKDVCNVDDFFAECASGSSDIAGMAVVPCSMGTLGRIAAGTSDNLLVRAADVCLKERRPLVIVPREMPYNLIHIENMKRVTLGGCDSGVAAVLQQAAKHRRACGYCRRENLETLGRGTSACCKCC